MANVRNGNTYYIDTTTTLELPVKVFYVTVTATAASAVLNLQDNNSTTDNKINLRVATSGETKDFDFSECPLYFPTGLKPNTVTNCVATIVFQEVRA